MDHAEEFILPLQSHGKVEIDIDDDLFIHQEQSRLANSILSRVCKRVSTIQLWKLLPIPVQQLFYPTIQSGHVNRATGWLDGIRGCAALVVFFEHMSLSIQDSHAMVRAYGTPGATSLWQLPIIRLLYDGTPMVPIFYVTSGCALSLKPLSHIHGRQWHDFGKTISSATFRRAFRLFLPSAAVSFVAMLFTQIGIYNHPYPFIDGNAIVIDRPQRLSSIAAQYVDWLNWVTTNLLYSEEIFQPLKGTTISNYGFQLWTISTEFYASIALFITIVGLSRLSVSKRQLALICICAYSFYLDRWDIACFIAGFTITELSIQAQLLRAPSYESDGIPVYARNKSIPSWIPTYRSYGFALLLLAGLFIASYPGKEASQNLIYQPFAGVVDNARFWQSIGAILILTSASQLSLVQRILTSAIPKYLGIISYGVYLTHVVFLNTFGWRIVPWIRTTTGDEGWFASQGSFTLGLAICLMFTIWIADLWTRAVDEPCVTLAKRVEQWSTVE